MAPLTDDQKEQKALNIIKGLELDNDLNNLNEKIDDLFADAPIEVADSISKDELQTLITEINAGTNDNNKISRFLEIANSLGI